MSFLFQLISKPKTKRVMLCKRFEYIKIRLWLITTNILQGFLCLVHWQVCFTAFRYISGVQTGKHVGQNPGMKALCIFRWKRSTRNTYNQVINTFISVCPVAILKRVKQAKSVRMLYSQWISIDPTAKFKGLYLPPSHAQLWGKWGCSRLARFQNGRSLGINNFKQRCFLRST